MPSTSTYTASASRPVRPARWAPRPSGSSPIPPIPPRTSTSSDCRRSPERVPPAGRPVHRLEVPPAGDLVAARPVPHGRPVRQGWRSRTDLGVLCARCEGHVGTGAGGLDHRPGDDLPRLAGRGRPDPRRPDLPPFPPVPPPTPPPLFRSP